MRVDVAAVGIWHTNCLDLSRSERAEKRFLWCKRIPILSESGKSATMISLN